MFISEFFLEEISTKDLRSNSLRELGEIGAGLGIVASGAIGIAGAVKIRKARKEKERKQQQHREEQKQHLKAQQQK